jgi:hypothetical protein
VTFGYREGRKPNYYFDGHWYIQTYPDVGALGANALQHYATAGFREGRNPSPLFDTMFYLKTYPDVRESKGNPLQAAGAASCGQGA